MIVYDQPTYRPPSQYGPILQGRPGSSATMGGPQPFGWGPSYDQQIPQQLAPQPGYSGYPGPGAPAPTFPAGPQSQSLPSTIQGPGQVATYGSTLPQGPPQQGLLSQGPVPILQEPQPQAQQPQSQVMTSNQAGYGTMAVGGYAGHQVSPPYSQQGPTPYPVQPQQPQQLYNQPQSQPAQPYQMPAQAEPQQPAEQSIQQSVQQAQPQPLRVESVLQYQLQTQLQPLPVTSSQTQPEPQPQQELQLQVQPQPISQQLETPQSNPQQQSQPQPKSQPISGPHPYPFDPSYSYADQNVQAWASYYAQGGTDPTGSVYFISIPGVKAETPSFALSNQQIQSSYDLALERPEQRALPQGVTHQGQPQSQPQPLVTNEQSYQIRPGPDGADTVGGSPGVASGPTSLSTVPRYQLSDNPVPQSQPQANDGYRPGPSRAGSGDNGFGAQPSSPVKSLFSTMTAPLNVKRTQSPIQPSITPSWVLPKKTSAPGVGPGQTNGGSPTAGGS